MRIILITFKHDHSITFIQIPFSLFSYQNVRRKHDSHTDLTYVAVLIVSELIHIYSILVRYKTKTNKTSLQ